MAALPGLLAPRAPRPSSRRSGLRSASPAQPASRAAAAAAALLLARGPAAGAPPRGARRARAPRRRRPGERGRYPRMCALGAGRRLPACRAGPGPRGEGAGVAAGAKGGVGPGAPPPPARSRTVRAPPGAEPPAPRGAFPRALPPPTRPAPKPHLQTPGPRSRAWRGRGRSPGPGVRPPPPRLRASSPPRSRPPDKESGGREGRRRGGARRAPERSQLPPFVPRTSAPPRLFGEPPACPRAPRANPLFLPFAPQTGAPGPSSGRSAGTRPPVPPQRGGASPGDSSGFPRITDAYRIIKAPVPAREPSPPGPCPPRGRTAWPAKGGKNSPSLGASWGGTGG
ncbi:basic proline-rich protein-like [Sarcophilus harrisii]|uniref:basic proline-rich protein-like n=1 Tax=Sarcophilus harrisii TaxID=9305 RepID=UPI001301C8D9|nr:basic proline-rich protein-like [Sarcophilus harrisii]